MNKRDIIILIALLILTIPVSLRAGLLDNNLRMISSDENGIVIEFEIPWPDITEVQERGGLYHKIAMPGFGTTTDVGRPQLPLRGVLIGVPDTSEPEIEVLKSDSSLLQGYNIYPAPRPVVIEDDGDKHLTFEFAIDKGVYNTDAFVPSRIAEIGSTGLMRDQMVVRVMFFPLQFNPVTSQLRFYSRIQVRVNFNTQTQSIGKSVISTIKRGEGRRSTLETGNAYERLLKGVLLNYDEMRGGNLK